MASRKPRRQQHPQQEEAEEPSASPSPPRPYAPVTRFLQFPQADRERQFLDSFVQRTLRRWEVISARLELFSVFLTLLCAASFWRGASISNWWQFGFQLADGLIELLILWGPDLLDQGYFRIRTPAFILLRLIYTPVRNAFWRSNFVAASTEQDGWWFACRMLVFFFPYATLLDTVRFPLPLKDHVWVQLMASAISGVLSGWACERALVLAEDQKFVYNSCSVLSIASTGVGLDCGQAEFKNACSAVALQVQALVSFFPSVMALHAVEKARRQSFSGHVQDLHES